MRQIRLEFSQGTSDKFWEGTATGTQVLVTFGRKGTAGQQKSWQFGTQAEAITYLERTVKEKISKGYMGIFDVTYAAQQENNSSASAEQSKTPTTEADSAASKEISSQPKEKPRSQVTMPRECIELDERERCYPIAFRKAPLAISTTRRSFEELKFTHSAIHSYSLVEQCLKEMAEIGPWSKEEALDWFYGMITRLGPLACGVPGITALTTAMGTLLEKSPTVLRFTGGGAKTVN